MAKNWQESAYKYRKEMSIMRKNLKKIMVTGVSGLLAAGLIVGSTDYASHMFILTNRAFAKQAEKISKNIKDSSKKNNDKEETTKHETVYQTLDANGTPTDTVVSDWLKNPGTDTVLNDVSELNDITNTKGDEEFTQDGGLLAWNTSGQDIYYQGTTNKQSPVGMEISYKLDGKDVNVNDIVGKSGKLEINIKYTNSSKKTVKIDGKDTDISTPFIMVTGMILPVDNFRNLSIDNGNILSEGDNNIVIAYGMPGLSESLDLNNFGNDSDMDIDLSKINDKITDTVKITADVKNFEMKSTYTIATSEFFKDIDLDDIGDTDELEDKMDELEDAAKELVSGSGKINKNLSKLDNKFVDYSDAIDTLHESTGTLDDGADKLKKGINSYTEGADKLLDGVITYLKGTKTLAKSAKEYAKNTNKLVNKMGELKSKGTEVLASGSEEFSTGLNTYVSTVNSILSMDTFTNMASGLSAINTGAGQLKDAANQTGAGIDKLKSGMESINAAANNITQYDGQVDGYLAELKKLYASTEDEGEKAVIMEIMNYVGTAQKVGSGIDASTSSGSEMASGFDAVSGGASAISAGLSEIEEKTGSQAIGGMSGSLTEGIGQLKAAGEQLVSSYDGKLLTGIKSLDKNVGALYSAGEELVSNNQKLYDGANTLIDNSKTIKDNSKKLMSNSSALREGIKELADGTGKLIDGVSTLVGKTGDVSDALGKLSDGAYTLADGMTEFRREGVKKLTGSVDDILDSGSSLHDKFKKIMDAADNYKSFSGIHDNMDGSVKFIMSTAEVTAEGNE